MIGENNITESPLVFVISQIENILADDLKERKTNAKQHPEDQIARLAGGIREFGFTVPLLIDGKNNIVAGHGRKKAGVSLGMQSFPCVRVAHLSKAQIAALVLFDNKISETGFDPALLQVEIGNLRDLDAELIALTGFTNQELESLAASLEPKPEKPKKTPEIVFGAHKIQVTLSELQALEGLVEVHLNRHGDLVGFVEKTLLNQPS